MAANRLGALRDDTDIFTALEGDNTVLTLLCARGILTGYAHEIGELNPTGLVTFVPARRRTRSSSGSSRARSGR
jgi:acyl-CoA oxidase